MALTLTRNPGQKIIIDDNIIISFRHNGRMQIKFDIEAPRDIKIYREEIYQRIKEENENKENDA